MPGLILAGAGGLAREVLAVVLASRRYAHVRVVDDNPALWGIRLDGQLVEGDLALVKHYADHEVVVCAGRGAVRRALVERLTTLGVEAERYATVAHPSVDVPHGCLVGAGSVLLAHTSLTAEVRLGVHVVAMPQVTFTHDDVVDDFATLCAGVSLGGGVRVGRAAYVGMNASVREYVTIGTGATVGMGAAVLTDVPPGETWAGVPARPLRHPIQAAG